MGMGGTLSLGSPRYYRPAASRPAAKYFPLRLWRGCGSDHLSKLSGRRDSFHTITVYKERGDSPNFVQFCSIHVAKNQAKRHLSIQTVSERACVQALDL